jgi:hypothetical protein
MKIFDEIIEELQISELVDDVSDVDEDSKLMVDLSLDANQVKELIESLELRLDVSLPSHKYDFAREDKTIQDIIDAVLEER